MADINKMIDELEKEADAMEPIDETLVKAAEAYVKTQYDEIYGMTRSDDVTMGIDKWNDYVLLDAFKAGAEWCMNELLKKWGNTLEDLNNEIDEIGIVGVLKKYLDK